jgi:long-chain acyl-CoA synthetase
MLGYYNKPEDTAAVLEDGWLRTGDLGYLDPKGYLHITGRKKEIIVLPNGKNINPEEIERELLRISDFITESGVFLKDGILQAIIRPDFKRLSESGIADPMEYFRWQVIDRFNQSVAPYKKILRFHFSANELPRTRLGKIKRFMLPELTGSKKQQKTPEPQSREYQAIKKFLESVTQQPVQPNDHLELDLALDSLGRVSLSAFIETAFGVDVPENGFSEFQSIAQLADNVRRKKTIS